MKITRMSWGTIIGAIVGIGGILATLLVFAIGECNEVLNKRSQLNETAVSHSRQMQRLESHGKSLEKELHQLNTTLIRNSEYKHDLTIYEEMNDAIAKAESALEKIGGSDVRLLADDLPVWRIILEEAGFELKKPAQSIT